MTHYVDLCPVRTDPLPIPRASGMLDQPIQTMRAVVMRRNGGPEVLELASLPVPRPRTGEALVEIHARGVNFSETETRRARHRPTRVPWIPGNEGAGVVVEIGDDVDPGWLGRRVAYYAAAPATSGSYADLATVPDTAFFALPDGLDFLTAAAIPQQGLTAWFLVHRAARVRAGQVVLVHAAAGGVGLLVAQLARAVGARVMGTISRKEKARAVQEAGGEPFLYGDDLVERVRAATGGRGVDMVLDSVGLPTQAASLAMLAPFGELVHFGEAGGFPAPVDPEVLYRRSLKVSAFSLDETSDPAMAAHARHDLIAGALSGTLRFRIGATMPLARAAEAHRLIESRESVGKIILVR